MVSPSTTYSTYDAKNKLSELLDRVERGEELTITRHGQAVAKLIPALSRQERSLAALEKLRELRESLRAKGVRVTQDEIREWINEGRQ